MGYSHYFKTGTLVFDEPFLADVRAIVREADAEGIALSGDPYGVEPRPPEVGPEGIVINGLGPESCEPLVLEPGGGAARDFCKTNRRPYDAVVGAILMRVAESRPDADVESDGSFLLDWEAARRLFAAALDREGPCPARVALATVRLDGSEPGDKAWGYLSVYPDGTAWCFGKAPMRRGGNEPLVGFDEKFDLGNVADFASRHGLDVSSLGSLVASSVGRTTSELNDELVVCGAATVLGRLRALGGEGAQGRDELAERNLSAVVSDLEEAGWMVSVQTEGPDKGLVEIERYTDLTNCDMIEYIDMRGLDMALASDWRLVTETATVSFDLDEEVRLHMDSRGAPGVSLIVDDLREYMNGPLESLIEVVNGAFSGAGNVVDPSLGLEPAREAWAFGRADEARERAETGLEETR